MWYKLWVGTFICPLVPLVNGVPPVPGPGDYVTFFVDVVAKA